MSPATATRTAPILCLALLLLSALLPCPAGATARRFAWSYEAGTSPGGSLETEHWITWHTDRDDDPSYDRVEFRHELEWGVTDRFQLGFYFSDWRTTWRGGRHLTEVRSSSIEAIYNLTDPATSTLGSAVYGEVKLGQEKLALEGKILLERDAGPWVVVYNAIVEAEWEGERWSEDEGELAQTLGVSLQLSPALLLGAELRHAVELPDWEGSERGTLSAGPSLSWRRGRWWVTSSPLWQLTDVAGAPGLSWRTLVGVEF